MHELAPPPVPGTPVPSRRLLLLEDEELVESLVRFALEGSGIELVRCRTVEEAERCLGERHFDLLLADLGLPGESGLSFLRRLRSVPGWSESLQVISFSSGLTPAVRSELESLGVHRLLTKPASVASLRACVSDAASTLPAEPPRADASGIEVLFDGDFDLFESFRRTCVDRFADEASQVSDALQAGDLEAAAVIVREWKSMLRLLGEEEVAQQASALEVAALCGDAFAADRCWPALHERLLAIEPVF